MSGVFVLVFTFPQTLWAILSGFYISKTNRYKIVIVCGLSSFVWLSIGCSGRKAEADGAQLIGAGLWALGVGLQIIWSPASHIGYVLGILQLQSIGIGFSLQTSEYPRVPVLQQLRATKLKRVQLLSPH
jgi:hypothetical protein